MATGRVQTGFFETRTWPAGPPLLPGPSPFNKRVFFLAPNLARRVSASPVQPLLGLFHGRPIQPNLIYNKIKKNPNPNTNQSTLLSVKSSNSIYHLWKKQNSDFYIYGQIFTSTQHSLWFLHIESSNKYPKTKTKEQNSIYHLWTDFYILNPQTNTQKTNTTERGNEPKKIMNQKEEEEVIPLNLSLIQQSQAPLWQKQQPPRDLCSSMKVRVGQWVNESEGGSVSEWEWGWGWDASV